MSEIAGNLALIKVSGDPVSFTGESTSTTDNQTYQIDDSIKRVWDRATEPTVYEDGVETTEEYEVHRLYGTITFVTADSTRGVITVDGKYLPMSEAAYAHAHTVNRQANIMDVSKYQKTHRDRISSLKFASGSLSHWNPVDVYFRDALFAGNPVVLEFSYDGGEPRRLWALFESDELSAELESPQDAVVSFVSIDELYNFK